MRTNVRLSNLGLPILWIFQKCLLQHDLLNTAEKLFRVSSKNDYQPALKPQKKSSNQLLCYIMPHNSLFKMYFTEMTADKIDWMS